MPATKPAKLRCYARSSSPTFPLRSSAVTASRWKTFSWPSPAELCNDHRGNPSRQNAESRDHAGREGKFSLGTDLVKNRTSARSLWRSPESHLGQRSPAGDEESAVCGDVLATAGLRVAVDRVVCRFRSSGDSLCPG